MDAGTAKGAMLCTICCACIFVGAWLTYIIWSIIAVSESTELKHSQPGCDTHSTVWWIMVIMLISTLVNIIVTPCLQPENPQEIQLDPEKRMKFLKSPLGICWLIYIGLALIMVIAMMFIGIRAWSSTTDKCASELPSDLWTLFKVTVVLYSIAGILLLCVTCCFGTAVLCGFPLDGSMGYEPGVAGSAPAYTCDNSDYSSYEKAEDSHARDTQGLLDESSDGNPVTQPSVPVGVVVGVVQSLPDKSDQPPVMPVIEVIEETGQASVVEPAVVEPEQPAAEQPAAELLDVQVEQPPTESAEVAAAPPSAI